MELLLEAIIKESNGNQKYFAVHENASKALQFMESYSRAPASDYRRQVLPVVQASLETGSTRLCQQSVSIIHKIGKDNRFYSPELEEDEPSWLTFQVCAAISPLPALSSDIQTDYLQAVLSLSYHSCWIVSGQVTLHLVSLCQELSAGQAAAKAAAQNVAANTLTAFARHLCKETEDHTRKRSVDEIIPVFQYLCSRTEECYAEADKTNKRNKAEKEFLICCLDTTIKSLHKKVTESSHFCTFLWRSLCPAVIKLLVRGAGHSIVCTLTSLIGHLESHRAVLEATFHKMMVQTPPQKRLEGLRAINRLVGEKHGLMDLTWLDKRQEDEDRHPSNDMAILIMILDSLEECANVQDGFILYEVVEVIKKICENLEKFCNGENLDADKVEVINSLYDTLESSDYAGPHTYTNDEDIPEEFRFIIQDSLDAKCDSYDTSSIATTTDSTNQIEVSYDSSDDSEDSENNTSSETDATQVPESLQDDTKLWLNKVPKCLYSPYKGVSENDMKQIEIERNNAATYHKLLKNRMFRLNSIRSAIEIDQKIQEFASQFCQDFSAHSPKVRDKAEVTIMNADGIYLTTYRVIHLNVKLKKEGHYDQNQEDQFPSISEKEFVESILESGILIYLSSIWLAEVYCFVLKQDLFEACTVASPIIHLCSDIDGFGTIEEHGQLLIEYKRLQEKLSDANRLKNIAAGRKYARRILTAIWDYIISICTKVMSNTASQEITSNLGAFLGSKRAKSSKSCFKEAQLNNTKVLQLLLRISKKVGFQNLSGSIFCLLSNEVCQNTVLDKKKRNLKFSCESLLALESVLSSGLELASHSQDCWKHIFKCCQYISKVEECIFRPNGKMCSPKKERTFQTSMKTRNSLEQSFDFKGQTEDIWLGFSAKPETRAYENVTQILTEAKLDLNRNEILPPETFSKAICFLTQQTERLFSDASSNLNMMSYIGYLRELCFQSHKELILLNNRKNIGPAQSQESLLVSQLSEAMLRCIRAGRSLLHIMLAWSVVGPHFMEASSHTDPVVSKIATQAIHDIITSLLHYNSEMPYFHFNESLFKPYETLILLELCDSDVQDQIIASIQQFVEGSSSEIRSGWRPLFGALRSIQMPGSEVMPMKAEPSHVRAILDVFEAFLSTDSPVVFAHAALDCIMCLIKHIKGSKEHQDIEELVDIREMVSPTTGFSDAALGYIVRCHSVLAKMYLMTACPVFRGAEKIHTGSQPVNVSCTIPGIEVISFDPSTNTLPEHPFSYESLSITGQSPSLLEHSGLLKVWFLLIDGVVSALSACQIKNQPATVSTFFTILQSLMAPNYMEFGMFCVNHLLLPGIQTWIRKTGTTFKGWHTSAQGIKQTVGMTTDLILDWIETAGSKNCESTSKSATLMLKQLVIILIECTVVNCETIARLGCSCFRHLITSGAEQFSEPQWEVVMLGIARSVELTLYPVHQLMSSFMIGSENFYGDIGTVRVAARRDTTVKETNRVRQLCHQILLLDNQREDVPGFTGNPDAEDRSYLFLLQPLERGLKEPKEDAVTVRVTLSELVTGLTAHHILLQIIGSVLLQGTKHLVPSLANMLLSSPAATPSSTTNLSGMTSRMTTKQLIMLMVTLKESHNAAVDMDSRPGMKFLLQKVAQIPHAANLYKQAGAAWSIRAVTLFDICLSNIRNKTITAANIQVFLEDHCKNKNTLGIDTNADDSKDENESKLFFCDLHDAFLEICETYIDIVVDKEGQRERVDKISQQQIFFFSIEPDSLEDLIGKLSEPPPEGERETTEGQSDVEQATVPTSNSNSVIGDEDTIETSSDKKTDGSDAVNNTEELITEEKSENAEEETECIADIDQNMKDENMRIQQAEDIIENQSHLEPEEKTTPKEENSPFQFSDFTRQPNRPDSPNIDEDSENEREMSSEETPIMIEKENGHEDNQILKQGSEVDSNVNVDNLPPRTQGDGKDKEDLLQIQAKQKVICQYKKRKSLKATMPTKNTRKNPFIPKQQTSLSRHPVDPEIEQQRSVSLVKDSEAQVAVWNELVVLILDLVARLNDHDFKVMLPIVFPGVKSLTAHASDINLKQQLAEFYNRVATIYGFGGCE